MPIDYRDLMLEVQAEVGEIVQEVMQELVEPQMIAALGVRWGAMPEDAKELLKKQDPKMYRRILQMIRG